MDFHLINKQLIKRTPQIFLNAILAAGQQEDAFIIFNSNIEEQLEYSAKFLSSSDTLSLDDIEGYKQNGFLAVAQTIDGDYIAGDENRTFVIPVSLYKSDIEIFDLFLSDFFIEYADHRIQSAILPNA